MAHRTFFSFHYERDVWRAGIVRNSWLLKPNRESAGYFDASIWEKAKGKGDAAIKKLIDETLHGTSVTAVLVGKETASRSYVKYEIEQSVLRGNGVLGVRIEKIANSKGETDDAGPNPLPVGYPIYRWNTDNGYSNFGSWVDLAATVAGK